MPCWKFNAPDTPFQILRALRAELPDVVIFSLGFATFGEKPLAAMAGLSTPMLARITRIPSIVLLHHIAETMNMDQIGYVKNSWQKKIIQVGVTLATWLLLRANYVVFTMPCYLDIIRKKYKAKNIRHIPHGSFYLNAEIKSPLTDAPAQILTFGRFGTYKRVEPVIEAYRLLRQKNTRPIQLVIAGGDHPNTPGYLDEVRKKFHDPEIIYTGYVEEENIPALFGKASLVVFPYITTTGSSGVLHHAATFKKPVVLPDIDDFSELMKEQGYTAKLFTPQDPQSLADSILEVLTNGALREKIIEQNYRAASTTPMKDIVAQYILLAKTLIPQKSKISTAREITR